MATPAKKIAVFPSQPTLMGCRLLHAAIVQGHRATNQDNAGRQNAIALSPTGSLYVATAALNHRQSSSGRHSHYAANAALGGERPALYAANAAVVGSQ